MIGLLEMSDGGYPNYLIIDFNITDKHFNVLKL